ncbi:MAG: hypothetical protein OHK0048_14130 [Rhodoferax sp.]
MTVLRDPAPVLPRRIAHVDMDAFYASVELLRYPQLKDVPLVIGGAVRSQDWAFRQRWADQPTAAIPVSAFERLGHYVGRGVVTTANYPARAFGVASAMGLMKAARLCPHAVLLPVDFALYRAVSQRFKAVITQMAPRMEDRGIDEVFVDFTDVPDGQREGGRVLARLIQTRIALETGLSCSVGVAPNKLLAKMASEFNKPGGIAVVHPDDVAAVLAPLACQKIPGIGPKSAARLAALGVHTIGELAQCPRHWLQQHFGKKIGAWMADAAHGLDDRPLVLAREPVSISRETTFARDLHAAHDKAELGALLTRLCEQLAADLARRGLAARTVGIKLRYADFSSVTRELTLAAAVAEVPALRRAAGLCLKRVDLTRRVRLMGVRCSALTPHGAVHGKSISNLTNTAQAAILFEASSGS